MLEYASFSVKSLYLSAIFIIVVSVLWGIGHFINYVRVMSTKMIIGQRKDRKGTYSLKITYARWLYEIVPILTTKFTNIN